MEGESTTPSGWRYWIEAPSVLQAGMTIPPMVVSMAMTALRIPFASLAAFQWGLGVRGIWMVIAATAALRGVVIAAWFSLGTWKRRTV